MVDDIEALRAHLGLRRMNLLGHCAGTNIVTQYAGRYPEQVSKLALISPSTRAVGIAITGETRRELALPRKNELWFPAAFAALEAITDGTTTVTYRSVDPIATEVIQVTVGDYQIVERPGPSGAAARRRTDRESRRAGARPHPDAPSTHLTGKAPGPLPLRGIRHPARQYRRPGRLDFTGLETQTLTI
ncbi:alpha/beta hydrolase [Streptomyces sp. H27-C3]|uniref:alpha/beta hydrolase n=1 Tax=Streptomyces sp. H27-C3 TaxID=3046305 RepID=UPI0032D8E0FE